MYRSCRDLKILKGYRALLFFALIGGACVVSCQKEDGPNDIYNGFPDQHLPLEKCGTWQEVMKGNAYFCSLTINTDGKVSAEYFDDFSHEIIPLKGKCYYGDGYIELYYEVGDSWCTYPLGVSGSFTNLNIGEDESVIPIIEWTDSTLVLADFQSALFMSRDKNVPAFFLGNNRPQNFTGGWTHSNGSHALDLNQDGTGTRKYVGSTYSITDWFVRDNCFYIKDGGNSHYEVYNIVFSGNTNFLYRATAPDWTFRKE